MGGQLCWAMATIRHIEIAGIDGTQLKEFYGDLFDWKMVPKDIPGVQYYDFEPAVGVTGGIRHEPEGVAEVVIYVGVESLDEAVAKAVALGATVRIPPMEYGELRFAMIVDPQGNPVGLLQE